MLHAQPQAVSPSAVEVIVDAQGRSHARFAAMASPWEVHVWGAPPDLVREVGAEVEREVRRLEHKYSRYRHDGIVAEINRADGRAVPVDDETARLLGYASALWQASDGRFDITTGALRRAWRFDGSDRVPEPAHVQALLPLVGWDKAEWDGTRLRLPAGMEIDFGGIGKEYAVDRALTLAARRTALPLLVNGGGDIAANAPPAPDQPWRVGIHTGFGLPTPGLQLFRGAVATSGDANRFLLKNGVRYSHVLDPRTGCPVPQAPRSVTVLAGTCSEAGAHSTIALLMGADAERYLREQECLHWIYRDEV